MGREGSAGLLGIGLVVGREGIGVEIGYDELMLRSTSYVKSSNSEDSEGWFVAKNGWYQSS